jgi:hypothetical protein
MSTDVSVEHIASIFRVEELAEEDISVKASGKRSSVTRRYITTTAVITSNLIIQIFAKKLYFSLRLFLLQMPFILLIADCRLSL